MTGLRQRRPSPVRERDLPRPLRRARGAVSDALNAEECARYPLGVMSRCPIREQAARREWVGVANEQWVKAVEMLPRWAS